MSNPRSSLVHCGGVSSVLDGENPLWAAALLHSLPGSSKANLPGQLPRSGKQEAATGRVDKPTGAGSEIQGCSGWVSPDWVQRDSRIWRSLLLCEEQILLLRTVWVSERRDGAQGCWSEGCSLVIAIWILPVHPRCPVLS